jgi:dolichol-phosphate mannosyltransferase
VTNSPVVFILLPVLNEIFTIGHLLDGIDKALVGRPAVLGILDDGSTDGTLEYLEDRVRTTPGRIALIRRRKPGPGCQRGSALRDLLRWGLAHTTASVFVEMDGDLSHSPGELEDGMRWLTEGGFDVAIASKYMAGSREVRRHPGRRLISRVCCLRSRTLVDRRIRDYSNGYRFYTRRAAEVLMRHEARNSGPIYLVEVLALWLREGMRVVEFPSTYTGRQQGSSKVMLRDLVQSTFALLSIAARYHVLGFREDSARVEASASR